jgi:ankyrin repeat protein
MTEDDAKYLADAFRDLINYESEDPMQAVDALTYLTPEGDSCLHIAAARGDLRAARILVESGADVNLQGDLGNTPLHYARKRAHADVVAYLVCSGASPDLVNEFGESALGESR